MIIEPVTYWRKFLFDNGVRWDGFYGNYSSVPFNRWFCSVRGHMFYMTVEQVCFRRAYTIRIHNLLVVVRYPNWYSLNTNTWEQPPSMDLVVPSLDEVENEDIPNLD